MTATYKVLQPNDDYRKALIQKEELSTAEFTLEQSENVQNKYSTEKREMQGQLTIEEAKWKNIEEHHPFVKEMSEQDQYTVWMYYQARMECAKLNDGIEKRTAALDEFQKEKELMMEVLGFTKSPVQHE
jgi:HD superfamily phosphohydrolase